MAILPSTSDTRGRNVVPKPLNASDSSRVGSPELDSKTDTDEVSPLSNSDVEEASLPQVDASPPSQEASKLPLHSMSDSEFWLHMTATLEACFDSFKGSSIDDDLNSVSEDLLVDAPRVMQFFLSHGDACAKIEAEALVLASTGAASHDEDEPLRVYIQMLDHLEKLQKRADSLELSISKLAGVIDSGASKPTDSGSRGSDEDVDELASSKLAAHLELRHLFAACLPVLRARKANLTMAQDLVDSAQENLSISLKMEYLGID